MDWREASQRLWRLERQVEDLPGIRQQLADLTRRVGLIEGMRALPTSTLKETLMVALIGGMVGMIYATGDPAGAVALLQRLLKG